MSDDFWNFFRLYPVNKGPEHYYPLPLLNKKLFHNMPGKNHHWEAHMDMGFGERGRNGPPGLWEFCAALKQRRGFCAAVCPSVRPAYGVGIVF